MFYIPSYIGWVGAQMLALGTILHSLVGIPINTAIIISAFVVILYTYYGGMWSVTITDFIQALILIICFVVLLIKVYTVCGDEILKSIPQDKFQFYPKGGDFSSWLGYFESWIIVGLGSLPAQDLVGRILSARNVKTARVALFVSAILYWTVGSIPVLCGIFAGKIFKEITPNGVLIDLAMKYFSLPLIGIMVGGLVSAIMSSVDSALLAPASIIGNNLIPPILGKKLTEKQKLFLCKVSVPIVGFFSLLIALYFKDIYQLCLESWTVLLVSVTAAMIYAALTKRAFALVAILASIFGVVGWIFLSKTSYVLPNKLGGFLVSIITIFIFLFSNYLNFPTHTL